MRVAAPPDIQSKHPDSGFIFHPQLSSAEFLNTAGLDESSPRRVVRKNCGHTGLEVLLWERQRPYNREQ